jgi:hypothetical protein
MEEESLKEYLYLRRGENFTDGLVEDKGNFSEEDEIAEG